MLFWGGGEKRTINMLIFKNWIQSLVSAQFIWISWATIDTSAMKYLCSCPEKSFLPSHPHCHPQESYSESGSRSWFLEPAWQSQSCVFPTYFLELLFWPWRLSFFSKTQPRREYVAKIGYREIHLFPYIFQPLFWLSLGHVINSEQRWVITNNVHHYWTEAVKSWWIVCSLLSSPPNSSVETLTFNVATFVLRK